MASKRDQLQAYQFLVQRAISALVTRETDPQQPPFRRPAGAAFVGIALAIISLACVGVYGMIVPGGNNSWRTQSAVIVEKETGTQYVYLNEKLYPVANYASALLLLGDYRSTVEVSRNSLEGVPRGPRIGIAGAPNGLPAAEKLLTGSWSLCSTPASDASGTEIAQSVLMAGAQPSGGLGLGDQALLVELVSNGDRYVVWRGYRHKINDYGTVGTGLALTAEPWARVDQAWLDVLPEGAPIEPVEVAQAGQPSTAVPGRTDILIGSLLVVQASGGGRQYYLAEHDALRPITELQYEIQLADAHVAQAAYPGGVPKALPLAPMLAAAARRLDPVAAAADAAPTARPSIVPLADNQVTACATFDPGNVTPRVVLGATLPPANAWSTTTGRSAAGTPLADRIYVPPGRAALVSALPSAGAPSGTLTLVTDMGRRYPLASSDVLKMLGYSAATPVRLPGGLVARVPEGAGLDPVAAQRVVS
ncbi:type VII secretion protein EccB [Amycolatopsis taiwanensis]|uniref:type VII secretion protein EccB n=1 Tax=Amycolatopsis taiwanensis TaxID=342230 RepID=UPI000483FD98|nr:type VII secretion protein EccB [Amycolatopsis taiwanensis]